LNRNRNPKQRLPKKNKNIKKGTNASNERYSAYQNKQVNRAIALHWHRQVCNGSQANVALRLRAGKIASITGKTCRSRISTWPA